MTANPWGRSNHKKTEAQRQMDSISAGADCFTGEQTGPQPFPGKEVTAFGGTGGQVYKHTHIHGELLFCSMTRSIVDWFQYPGILFPQVEQKGQTGLKPFFRARCLAPDSLTQILMT